MTVARSEAGLPSIMSGPPTPAEGAAYPPASLAAYSAAVLITVVAILSQYFLPQLVPAVRPVYGALVTDLLVVYGIPILAFLLLVGRGPLRNYVARTPQAAVEGLRWYGAMSILGLLSAVVIVIVLEAVDPAAVAQLSKLSPPLVAAESDPWFWIAFSFVIGLVEETIFRGWVFGYWLARDPAHWVVHAVWTSALFASVHLYYGSTYGFASAVAFAELFFAGLGFAFAVRYSRGNLLVVGLLHGAHDSLSFSTLVWKPWGADLYYLLILVGAIIFIAVALGQRTTEGPLTPWQPGPAPSSSPPGGNPAIVWPGPPPETYDRPPLPSPPPPGPPPA